MERRKFLESACRACVLAGAGILVSDLTACSPSANIIKLPVVDNTVQLPLASFTANQVQIVRPSGWLYNIAVHKKSDDQYEALLMECTHQQNQLIATSNGFQCTLHGSQFNIDGQVTKGPAERALKNYKTSIIQDQLNIQLKS